MALMLVLPWSGWAQGVIAEHTAKAQYMYAIIQNTIFPPEVIPKAGAPWRILVFGKFPSRSDLIAAIGELQELDGRRIEVMAVAGLPTENDLAGCQVVYIDNEISSQYVARTLELLQDRPLLVVSDKDIPADRGGMVHLKVGRKPPIEIHGRSAGRRKFEFKQPLQAFLK